MIVECPECNKRFIVKDDMIPTKGRHLQCGKCSYNWFFKPHIETIEIDKSSIFLDDEIENDTKNKKISSNQIKTDFKSEEIKNKKNIDNNKEITQSRSMIVSSNKGHKPINYFKLFFVVIITLISLVILLDTFKSFIINFFPNIDLILNNLYETFKDINLFLKDLVS